MLSRCSNESYSKRRGSHRSNIGSSGTNSSSTISRSRCKVEVEINTVWMVVVRLVLVVAVVVVVIAVANAIFPSPTSKGARPTQYPQHLLEISVDAND